jgi:hypothetical protein
LYVYIFYKPSQTYGTKKKQQIIWKREYISVPSSGGAKRRKKDTVGFTDCDTDP